jgi:hypothetical protein
MISDMTLPPRAAAASDQVAWRARAVAIGATLSAEHAPPRQFSIAVGSCDPERVGIAVALEAAPASVAEEQAP